MFAKRLSNKLDLILTH